MGRHHLPEWLGQTKERGCARHNGHSGMPQGCVSPVQAQKEPKAYLLSAGHCPDRAGCRQVVWLGLVGDKVEYTATGSHLDSSSTWAAQQVSPSCSGRCRALSSSFLHLIIVCLSKATWRKSQQNQQAVNGICSSTQTSSSASASGSADSRTQRTLQKWARSCSCARWRMCGQDWWR